MPIGLNHNTEIARPNQDSILEIGGIYGSARATVPTGYLLCDGSLISRVTYSKLFNAIGTTYGTGDGSTTFAIPDLRGAVPRGSGTSIGYMQNVTVVLGAKDNDAMQGHRHNRRIDGQNEFSVNTSSVGGYTVTGGQYLLTNETHSGDPVNNGFGAPRSNSNETKMKNLGVNFFIKF